MSSYFVLAAAALASAQPAATTPPQALAVRFVGRTATEGAGVRDQALAELMRFAGHALRCTSVEEIRVTPHPDGWEPADPNFRLGPAGSVYERWDTTMCGRIEPFLIVFWREGERSDFQVAHPYPTDRARGAP